MSVNNDNYYTAHSSELKSKKVKMKHIQTNWENFQNSFTALPFFSYDFSSVNNSTINSEKSRVNESFVSDISYFLGNLF